MTPTESLEESAKEFLLKLDGVFEDGDDGFMSGAKFGANWQQSQQSGYSEAQVREIIAKVLKEGIATSENKDYKMGYEDGISDACIEILNHLQKLKEK
jgi:hypothetical protein